MLQFVRRPSRQPSVCYEIRGDLGALALFCSAARSADSALVVGHERLPIAASELRKLVTAVDAVSAPVRVPLENRGLLDGVKYEITAFGGVGAMSRFSWSAGYAPDAWTALASLAESAVARFDGLKAVPVTADSGVIESFQDGSHDTAESPEAVIRKEIGGE